MYPSAVAASGDLNKSDSIALDATARWPIDNAGNSFVPDLSGSRYRATCVDGQELTPDELNHPK